MKMNYANTFSGFAGFVVVTSAFTQRQFLLPVAAIATAYLADQGTEVILWTAIPGIGQVVTIQEDLNYLVGQTRQLGFDFTGQEGKGITGARAAVGEAGNPGRHAARI